LTIEQFYAHFEKSTGLIEEQIAMVMEIEKELQLPQFKQKILGDLDQIQDLFMKYANPPP
jgi:hypothetical protein